MKRASMTAVGTLAIALAAGAAGGALAMGGGATAPASPPAIVQHVADEATPEPSVAPEPEQPAAVEEESVPQTQYVTVAPAGEPTPAPSEPATDAANRAEAAANRAESAATRAESAAEKVTPAPSPAPSRAAEPAPASPAPAPKPAQPFAGGKCAEGVADGETWQHPNSDQMLVCKGGRWQVKAAAPSPEPAQPEPDAPVETTAD